MLETLATTINVNQRKLSQQAGTTGCSFITVFQEEKQGKDNLNTDRPKINRKIRKPFHLASKTSFQSHSKSMLAPN